MKSRILLTLGVCILAPIIGLGALYGALAKEKNLSDLTDAATALENLGLDATAAEINALDGITATVAELNILDGVTSTAAELNALDGITSTVAELNILDGVTSTAAELNILDTVTSTAAELNILDGVTVDYTEINRIGQHVGFVAVTAANGGADTVDVTIQVYNMDGTEVTYATVAHVWLSDNASGAGGSAHTHSTAPAFTTGEEIVEHITDDFWLVLTDATGTAVLQLVDTGTEDQTISAVAPNGRRASDTTVAGDWSP